MNGRVSLSVRRRRSSFCRIRRGNRMEEGAGDAAAPPACFLRRAAFAIGNFREWRVTAHGSERGIVEFMAADERSAAADDAVGEKPRGAIPEMQPPFGEAC